MADVQPLRALRYDLARTGPLDRLLAPPYDVIDAAGRADLAGRSPHNVVRVDLPEADDGGDPYAAAAAVLAGWREEGAVLRDETPAFWVLEQRYRAPDGRDLVRTGVLCRLRVEPYGAGRVRPHERTHPGPKEDRLRLTRATRANLSPIFVLGGDPSGGARAVLDDTRDRTPDAAATTDDGTANRLWRVDAPDAVAAVRDAFAAEELLIADGHHRYETARVYADEVGGEGDHRYVLACLVPLEDPGLTVFPTHRLLRGLGAEQQETLAAALREHFDVEEIARDELVPEDDGTRAVRLGYLDAHFRRPFRLTLKDPDRVDAALPDRSEAMRGLDTAVLEALVLKGALGMSDDDISHLNGLGYARSTDEALRLVDDAAYDCAFFMAGTPIARIRDVAAAGESMPPKSTFFHPKVPTGLLFNPLAE